ncbi:MAG: Coenzyme F420 hydrogenase/dehydrogenase, beta subunit C-terminal domain [Duncaniella sp.]|nr:Coenzyme F420 hydrogenase/dehydrogenase, beta subunit C-terminal domain [Duncaniella sp.]
MNNLYLRPACYTCPFRGHSYAGDITLGDCWGFERLRPSADNSRGVSLVMAHTPVGKARISDLDILVRFGPSEIETLRKSNGGLVRNIGVNSQRHDFFKKLTTANSVSTLIAYCLKPSLLRRIKGSLQNKLASLLK